MTRTKTAKSDNGNTDVDVSRRSMATMVVGLSAVGLGALSGCRETAMDPERLGAGAEALSGTGFRWADTIGSPAAPGDLRGLVGLTTGETVVAKGFWAISDGGGGIFHWTTDTTSDDNWGLVVVPSLSAFPSGIPTGCWKRVATGTAWNVRWFGAKATGDTAAPDDDTEAFQRAIDSFVSPVVGDINGGPRLYVPAGAYRIGDVRIDKQVHLFGAGAAAFGGSTRLMVPAGVNGFIVDDYITCRAMTSGGTLTSGRYSIIENLAIVGASGSLDGALVYAHGVVLRDLWITSMGRNGISIRSDVKNPDPDTFPNVNANAWRVEGCRIDLSGNSPTPPATPADGGNGLYTESGDANAGTCATTDFTQNYWYGVFESSMLGNTYLGASFSTNGHPAGAPTAGGSILVDHGTNTSVFVGCYAEDDNRADIVNGNVTVMGGVLAGAFGVSDTLAQRVGTSRSRLYFTSDPPNGRLSVDIPRSDHRSALLFDYRQADELAWSEQRWGLKRFKVGSDSLSESDGSSPYYDADYLFDRCWGFWHVDGGDPTKVAIGWSDVNHPRGPGHPFFRKASLNQKGHFSVRTAVAIVPGMNTVDVVTTGWLVPEAGASFNVSFSIEVTPGSLASADLQLGAHAIEVTGSGGSAAGTLRVKVRNPGGASIAATIVAHIEAFKPWYTSY
jgi:hypothetical protein